MSGFHQTLAALDGLLKPLVFNATSEFAVPTVERLRDFRIVELQKRAEGIDRSCLQHIAAAIGEALPGFTATTPLASNSMKRKR